MNRKTRSLTLSALFAALTIVVLYISVLWPTGQLALSAVASFFTVAAVIESGIFYGVYVYAVSAILGFILLPDKTVPLYYILFFGYYPIAKSLIERIEKTPFQWVLKLLVFVAALTVMWLFVRVLLIDYVWSIPNALIVYAVGCAVFVLYDYGYSKAIGLYLGRVSKFIKKGSK